MTGNYGGWTGEMERELGARGRVEVSSNSMSSASSNTLNLLWSFTASFDPFDCLFDMCLSFVGFVFELCLFVFVSLVVLMIVYLKINSFCFANRPAVVRR